MTQADERKALYVAMVAYCATLSKLDSYAVRRWMRLSEDYAAEPTKANDVIQSTAWANLPETVRDGLVKAVVAVAERLNKMAGRA